MSKILRTVALTADTTTAAMISHAKRLPIQVVAASMTRDSGNNAFRTASRAPTCIPLCPADARALAGILIVTSCPHGAAQRPSPPP